MLRYRGNFTPVNIMQFQDYLDKINSHNWKDAQLKSALDLAVYINYALIEYGEATGNNIDIDLESIINAVIKSDSV